MWSLALLLLVLYSVRPNDGAACISPECLTKCIKSSTISEGNYPLSTYRRRDGVLFEVMGLTRDCVFFTFVLGEVSSNPSVPKWDHNKYERTGACEGKRLMQMRTTGIDRKMIFIVDFMGRRVRIQSVFEARSKRVDNVLYLLPDVRDRRLHVYTQAVEEGFTLESMFNANYHVYVLARNHYEFRLFELTVEMDSHLNLVPYLREEAHSIDPGLQPPFEDPQVTAFHYLDMDSQPQSAFTLPVPSYAINKWCVTSWAAASFLALSSSATQSLEKSNGTMTSNATREAAEILVKKILPNYFTWIESVDVNEKCLKVVQSSQVSVWGMAMWSRGRESQTLAIPYTSIMSGSRRSVNKEAGLLASRIRYQEKWGRFIIKQSQCVDELNYIMAYQNEVKKTASGMEGRLNHFAYTTKRFFNELNYNRRMATPHSISHRNLLKTKDGTRRIAVHFITVFVPVSGLYLVFMLGKWVSRMIWKKKGALLASRSTVHTN